MSVGRYRDAESALVTDLVNWAIMSGVKKGDPFFSRWKRGRRLILRSERLKVSMQQAVEEAGIDKHRFTPHSFRIGGATSMAAVGASRSAIKELGGWKSNADLLYTRDTIFRRRGALSAVGLPGNPSSRTLKMLLPAQR